MAIADRTLALHREANRQYLAAFHVERRLYKTLFLASAMEV
jgi:hypothetical protein